MAKKHESSFDIDRIRSLFPMLSDREDGYRYIYFDSAASSLKPKDVADTMSDYYLSKYSSINRGSYKLAEKNTILYESSRERLKRFLNVGDDYDVVFTSGATESINIVARSIGHLIKPQEDMIATSILEHHSNYLPWKVLAQEKKADLKILDINDAHDIDINSLDKELAARVKIAAFTHASNVTGKLQDLSGIIDMLRLNGTYILIDGAQSVPHVKMDLRHLNPDFYVFSAHKMLGPLGIGALVLKKDMLEKMQPVKFGGGMVISCERSEWKRDFSKLEAGTPNFIGVLGWMAALDTLEKIGMEEIDCYIKGLTEYLMTMLKDIHDVSIVSCEDIATNVGIISFKVDGIHPHDISAWLDHCGISVRVGHHCAQPLMGRLGLQAVVRISLYFYNTTEEIDFFIECLKKLLKNSGT